MKYSVAVMLIFSFTGVYGQSKTKLPVWTFNTTNTNIYGLAVGHTTTEKIQNVNSNGVRFELIGWGLLLPLMPSSPLADNDSLHSVILKQPYAETINGISLSPLGTGCSCKINGLNIYGVGSVLRQVNGVSVAVFMNFAELQNGVMLNIFFNGAYTLRGAQVAFVGNTIEGTMKGLQVSALNSASDLRGVQIGIYNKAIKGKGIQIGLWNKNQKRSLPIFNWNFRDSN